MAAIEVGAKYSCFEDFQAAFAKFCRETNSIYTVFNSKSIETENRGRPADKLFPVELKYRFIKYTCKHYGSNRSKSRGLRPNQSSFKIGCPAYIYVSVHKNELVIEKMESSHSHACDPDVLNFYPERRSLSEYKKPIVLSGAEDEEGDLIKSVREDVLDLLRLHIDRRRIRNYVRLRTNRILLPADLSNFAKQSQNIDKEITDERSYQLLDMLTALESKENTPGRLLEDLAKKEKFNSLKRKIAHVKAECATPGVSETVADNVQEHGYSNPPKRVKKWWNLNKNKDLADALPARRELMQSQGIEWDSRTLEEMVKTINPNEEGPVLVHMNNYDGVMVVEIQDGQGSVTQLEGTVVEVQDELVGDESRLLGDASLEDGGELRNGPTPNTSPQKISQGLTGKTKKIIQFRKRENKPEVLPGKSDQKNLLDLALESVQCNPKVEDLESNEDMMDNQSDAGSDNVPAFGDCPIADEYNNDGDEGYVDPVIKGPERVKLEVETEMLRVKTNKLKLQVKYLSNELSKQELEKEKLRLEIVLLKARIGVNELN